MSEERLIWPRDMEKIVAKRSLMKITEPTSAWDIMEWTIQHVKEEPRRLQMATWGSNPGLYDEDAPACGTAACFSGWSEMRAFGNFWQMKDTSTANLLAGYQPPSEGNDWSDDDEGYRLRTALYYRLFVDDDLIKMDVGPAMVEAVEKRAREIMAEFETRLKSVIIYPDGHYERRTVDYDDDPPMNILDGEK